MCLFPKVNVTLIGADAAQIRRNRDIVCGLSPMPAILLPTCLIKSYLLQFRQQGDAKSRECVLTATPRNGDKPAMKTLTTICGICIIG